ncbi:VPLPA-CTERM sorting domain-containing protein [Thalassococcus sp. BH17M4-6]|uniref:VPLPA-CTERM sorting domain-containing protein n=1 Tax=Thalassococcus sp. BH17M4-6 TaxID=3413148 RepID=UPI003BC1140B
MIKKILMATMAAAFLAPAAQASSFSPYQSLTFNALPEIKNPGKKNETVEIKSWTLTCTHCSMTAFFDTDGLAYDNTGALDIVGSLGEVGSAFGDLSSSGDSAETAFLNAAATAAGDTPVSGSFQKTGDTSDPNAGIGVPTDDGDYFLWKASGYAGLAKILEIGENNSFTFTGRHDLSHTAHISVFTGDPRDPPSPVPLPAGLPLLLGGLGIFALIRRRQGSRASA